MKIAWFIHRYYPCLGGAETYARAMVRRFVAAGHEVDVFTSDAHELAYFTNPRRKRVDAPGESLVDGARVRRFPIRHLPGQRYVGRLLSYVPHWPTRCRFASYMPILPGIERVRADYDAVFGVGFPFTVFSLAALRTARAAGAPLILTPFLHLSTPGDVVNRTYTQPHQKRLLAEADTIVTHTALEARMIEGWGIPRSRLFHLPMAVEHAEVTGGDGPRFRSRHGIPDGVALVGQLGVLDPNKGTNDLILALAHLNAGRTPSESIHLVLAGTPTPEFLSAASEFLASRPGWLQLLGPLAPGEVPDFYDAIDVFAMPSRTDSFGIVFLEAWANARPVVAAAAGGVVEVVHHNENGLLVPFGDVARLADSIDELLTDREKARRLAQNGLAMVTNGYTWDDRYASLERHLNLTPPPKPRAAPHRRPAQSSPLPRSGRGWPKAG